MNLDEYADVGTLWISLYVLNNDIIYFDCFGVEHVSKEVKKFIENKNKKTNMNSRMQASNSIMCGYICIGLILCLQAKI